MQSRTFGPTSTSVSVVGQGTWNMEGDDRSSCIAALRAGLDAGMTHIDTAELYGGGKVEEIVAEAIAGRRDEVFLVSKVLPHNASRTGTIEACERSLRRLRTDRLDGYLLHWPGDHPLEETIEAFEQLVEDGKIAWWGVSNFDVADLEAALDIAGAGRIACNQVLYHLGERAIEHAVLPWCEREGVAVVGYTPFGRSRFPPRSPSGEVLKGIAERRGATARQIALAFLTRRPGLFAIPKSADPEHVRENAAAAAIELGRDEISALEAAFPLGRRRAGVPMI
jgi:diketogulonate reductase-like aldo/keto reductase